MIRRANTIWILICSLLIVGATSCNTADEELTGNEIIVDIERVSSSVSKIKVKPVRLLQLKEDTLHVIASVTKLIPAGSNFIVCDLNGYKIYLYDSAGKAIAPIGKLGEGPNEYTNISDVYYDEQEQLTGVWNTLTRTVKYFDARGVVTKTRDLGTEWGVGVLYGESGLLFDKWTMGFEPQQYALVKYNQEKDSYELVQRFGKIEKNESIRLAPYHTSDREGKSFYAIPVTENTLWKVDPDGQVTSLYNILIKDKNYHFITAEETKRSYSDQMAFSDYRRKNNIIEAFGALFYFDGIGFTFHFSTDEQYYLFYSFKEKEVRRIPNQITDMEGNVWKINRLLCKYNKTQLIASVENVQRPGDEKMLMFFDVADF